jgi:hypothetical protein
MNKRDLDWGKSEDRHEICKSQIARLAQMRDYPATKVEALRELVNAAKHATDQKHLARIITGILEEATPETHCPMPRTLRDLLKPEKPWEPPKQDTPECGACGDSGITGGFVGGPEAEWCRCAAGRKKFDAEPLAVIEANAVQRKLAEKFSGKIDPKAAFMYLGSERKSHADVKRIIEIMSEPARKKTKQKQPEKTLEVLSGGN